MTLLALVSSMLKCSEKSATIARKCREQESLFQLLIEEKSGSSKNPKFAHDFKTLADVIIQETVRHDLAKSFDALATNIRGEESNVFSNSLNESIEVAVCDTVRETSSLLANVLNKDTSAATLLAEAMHSDVDLKADVVEDLECQLGGFEENIDIESLGIWIDPIDSTNSYIMSGDSVSSLGVNGWQKFVPQGLQVVTFLLGVYNRRSGKPLIGVINQPFSEFDEKTQTWKGQLGWGVSLSPTHRYVSSTLRDECFKSRKTNPNSIRVVVGKSDSSKVQKLITDTQKIDLDLVTAAGAGYKLLSVIRSWNDVYLAIGNNTFKWDSCACHAIINALGGGIVGFKSYKEIIYTDNDDEEDPHSNADGLICYLDSAMKTSILGMFPSS